MYRRDDPRFRRRLDQLSHNVESATEHAQENLYSFSQNYITPCLSSVSNSLRSCTTSCFPATDDRRKKHRARSRGRAELSFDFYDDWDEDETDALLGWGNSSDELDRLLAGSGGGSRTQPGRERTMNYGTRQGGQRTRRKSAAQIEATDPNLITGSNYLGFLERLPWGLGRKVLRYKPSAADLQEHPAVYRPPRPEQEPLMEESEEEYVPSSPKKKHKRNRSGTGTSGHTTDSLSSRGDLFPSEDEDDAVPLDDEFANILERRSTGEEGRSKSKARQNKSNSRLSVRTVSSKSTKSDLSRKASSSSRKAHTPEPPTFSELKAEEEQIRQEEDVEVARKRDAAQRLAVKRGLSSGTNSKSETRSSSPRPEMTDLGSKSPSSTSTVPFPTYDPPAGPQTPRSEADVVLEATPEAEAEAEAENEASDAPRAARDEDEEEFTPAALPSFSRSSPPA
jgi:hypothetical protein